jgi:hypothetical protein
MSSAARAAEDGDRKDVESKVEVGAEAPFRDLELEVAIGGSHHPDVDGLGRLVADPFEALLLEHPQQLGLHVGGNLADLVQKQGAAVGQAEAPDAIANRSGEGPPDVAEELALEELSGDRGAVDRDQGPRAASTPVWISRATSPLPVPVSPSSRTLTSVGAASLTFAITS